MLQGIKTDVLWLHSETAAHWVVPYSMARRWRPVLCVTWREGRRDYTSSDRVDSNFHCSTVNRTQCLPAFWLKAQPPLVLTIGSNHSLEIDSLRKAGQTECNTLQERKNSAFLFIDAASHSFFFHFPLVFDYCASDAMRSFEFSRAGALAFFSCQESRLLLVPFTTVRSRNHMKGTRFLLISLIVGLIKELVMSTVLADQIKRATRGDVTRCGVFLSHSCLRVCH